MSRDTDDMHFDRLEREADILVHLYYDDEEMPIVEPCRVPTPCTVPIKPGSQHAQAAFKAGCDDEHSDRMRSRYGGEW
jgi:hypothetical protein